MIIEFTIKTLDSNNHHVSADDEITILQLKEKLREQMGIELPLQRLIFCGRVLQDDKKLSDYDVDGKVIHLVQRAPPSPHSRHSAPPAPNNNATNADPTSPTQQQIRRLMALSGPPGILIEEQQVTPTSGRLDFVRRIIGEIKTTLVLLQAHVNGDGWGMSEMPPPAEPTSQMETDPLPDATQDQREPAMDENGDEVPDAARSQNARRRAIRVIRARACRPRDLGLLIEELEELHEEFTPFRMNYMRLLRESNHIEPTIFNDEERNHHQRTVDMTNDVMHSIAHAYHAISDINFQVGMRHPRLTSDATTVRHPIPMQAHINVVQSNRRGPNQQSGGANPSQAPTSTNAGGNAPAPATNPPTTEQAQAASQAQAGRSAQPTINIDPITYQVEIETRVPIAIALENALFNGLINPGTNQQQSTEQAQPQTNQAPNSHHIPNPANRRQLLFDFENLIRGLGQTAGGVEVVMSMEEISEGNNAYMEDNNSGGQGAPAGRTGSSWVSTGQPGGINGTGINFGGIGIATATGLPFNINMHPTEVYLAPIPWGSGPQTAELENLISSVLRPGVLPGVDGVAVHAHIPVNPTADVAAAAGPAAAAAGPAAAAGESRPAQPNPQQAGENNNQPRQPSLHVRRTATTPRAQTISLNHLIYDRFLHCESPHARRRLQRRREHHQHQMVLHDRLRSDRAIAQNFESIRPHVPEITAEMMQLLLQLLSAEPSYTTYLNAVMVVLARYMFQPSVLRSALDQPPLEPSEFQAVRTLLRHYLQNLITRSGATAGEGRPFESTADFLVQQYAFFIRDIPNITPIREEVDFINSYRAMLRMRLPALIDDVMNDSNADSVPATFYEGFHRIFMDLLAIVSYTSGERHDGAFNVYRQFVELCLEDISEPARSLIRTLALATHRAVIDMSITSRYVIVSKFIRRSDDTIVPREHLVRSMYAPRWMWGVNRTAASSNMSSGSDGEAPKTHPSTSSGAIPKTRVVKDDKASGKSKSSSSCSKKKTQHKHVPSQTVTNQSPGATSHKSSGTAKSGSSSSLSSTEGQSNVRFISQVPPMLIVQNWDEEWVGVLEGDREAQRGEGTEPYSDAYLSGMPARKRRRLRNERRPPTTLDGFINETIGETSPRSSRLDSVSLRGAFREHVRRMAQTRAASSQDFDPLRHVSAARFLRVPRSGKEQSESSSES